MRSTAATACASAMVGPFDPGHDRDAQLLTGHPGAPVEDIPLQQGEETLDGGVVAARGHCPPRSNQAVAGQCAQELPAAKLRPSGAVNDATGDIAAHGDRVLESPHREGRFHPGADGVSNDLVPEHVFDRAEIELALAALVLGDVGQPPVVGLARELENPARHRDGVPSAASSVTSG